LKLPYISKLEHTHRQLICVLVSIPKVYATYTYLRPSDM
jgi:hypothetical protein